MRFSQPVSTVFRDDDRSAARKPCAPVLCAPDLGTNHINGIGRSAKLKIRPHKVQAKGSRFIVKKKSLRCQANATCLFG